MTKNLKIFLKEAYKNGETKEKLNAMTEDEMIQLASEHGVALSKEDFKPSDDAELSIEDLGKVAGGFTIREGQAWVCPFCGSTNIQFNPSVHEMVCYNCFGM